MPLYIKDDATAALVAQLARAAGVTKSEAVRRAVAAELARLAPAAPEPLALRTRFAQLRARHPLPAATGAAADKAFFDDLSDA
ncbi:type II toxin-antitoxin system VapB family antitoxin [Methylobacterium sp. BTF04]|uniref:type II toxin-antitoxin system VapB family antitoxin n=1 Tax=Methylobacterium sp. BTF04 TaxID=2708300 RepID=UPI0013D470AF|nr:type II toxin-antitoxin system VapB family antitoxin [Methylobacterium sp. BTF04]NEU14055.1 type II toxin-antitoxin system VapB family antitoxin [Methylobacterium sp. BTF04]